MWLGGVLGPAILHCSGHLKWLEQPHDASAARAAGARTACMCLVPTLTMPQNPPVTVCRMRVRICWGLMTENRSNDSPCNQRGRRAGPKHGTIQQCLICCCVQCDKDGLAGQGWAGGLGGWAGLAGQVGWVGREGMRAGWVGRAGGVVGGLPGHAVGQGRRGGGWAARARGWAGQAGAGWAGRATMQQCSRQGS